MEVGNRRYARSLRAVSSGQSQQRGHPERSAARAKAGRRGGEGSREFVKLLSEKNERRAGIPRDSSLRIGPPPKPEPMLRSE